MNNTAVTLEAALEGGISRQEFEQQTRDFPGSYYGVMNGTVISNADERQRDAERGVLPDCPAGQRAAEQYFVVLYAF